MYHEIAEDNEGMDVWTIVRKSDYMRQMQYVQNHFEVISLCEALRRLRDNTVNEPTIVVTFDDGYACNKSVLLPIVECMDIPITIFISTGFVMEQKLYWYDRLLEALTNVSPMKLDLLRHGLSVYEVNRTYGAANWLEKERLLSDLKRLNPEQREKVVTEVISLIPKMINDECRYIAPLTIEDVLALSQCPLVTIGAHTHCHNILTQLSDDSMKNSVQRSKDLLELWTGKKINYFAYPNGNYNENIIGNVRGMGFVCALTTRSAPWTMKDSLFAIPRIGVGRYDSFDTFKAKISGAYKYSHKTLNYYL